MTYYILSDNEGLKVWKANDIKEELSVMAIRELCKRIKGVYDNHEIVILEHYYAKEYLDNGVIFRYDPKRLPVGEVYETEPLIHMLYTIMKEEFPGCHTIPYPENTIGISPHRFGLSPLHYHPKYYEYGKKCLRVITSGNFVGGVEEFVLEELKERYEIIFDQIRNEAIATQRIRQLEERQRVRTELVDPSLDTGAMCNLLSQVWDISLYIECIRKLTEIDDNIAVLCAVRDTPGGQGAAEVAKQMHRLGFSKFRFGYGIMYAGLIYKCKVVRDLPGEKARDPITTEYRIDNRVFELESHGYLPAKNYCSIRVNSVEYALNKRGINIVLYDMDKDELVDSICYDSHLKEEKYFHRKDKTVKCT